MNDDISRVSWPEWDTVRMIGRGSFGSVYEIQRDLFGDVEKAALKVISIPQHDSDIEELYSDGYTKENVTKTFQNHLQSILDEYKMMKMLNECVNIVNCESVRYQRHEDGIGWDITIKMELLVPLHKALPAEITDDLVIRIGMDMCSALEMCKKHGVVHRDIKPQNIFVSPNGNFKLGDFGIAKTVEKTTGGTKIGTYKYMAPEVYMGRPYGSSADIYSLGLVLYWLLNERRMPFMPLPPEIVSPGMAEKSRMRRLSGERLHFPAHGSEQLKRIVLKACAYDPADRYSSAAEMRRDLLRLRSGKSINQNAGPANEDGTMYVFREKQGRREKPDGQYGAGIPENRTKRTDVSENDTTGARNTQGRGKTPGKGGCLADQGRTVAEVAAQRKNNVVVNEQQGQTGKTRGKKLPVIIGVIAVVAVALICLLVRGCGLADIGLPSNAVPGETTELLRAEEFMDLYLGETIGLQIDGEDGPYTYRSSDKKIVKVNNEGEITGAGIGTATITVTGAQTETLVSVTVRDYEMILSTDELSLFTEATAILEVLGIPEDAVVAWRSDNNQVATVENGLVTAVGEGSATVTATWKNGRRNYSSSTTVTVSADGIALSTYQISSIYIGETATITAETAGIDQSVSWTSSDSKVVTVSDGRITAVGAGSAEITATAGNRSASCTVTVVKPSVSLDMSDVSLYIGDGVILSATTDPGGVTVNWSSDNTGVATVNGGRVTAVGAGTATIRAKITYAGNDYEMSCKITVTKPTVSLNKGSVSLYTGDSASLSATTNPGGGTITWSSSNSGVVTVSGGKITAVKAGTATVYAKMSYRGVTYEGTCKVTVTDPSVRLDRGGFSMMPGDSARISATTQPGGISVTWSSSNSGVATVSNGNVRAVAVGNATITAKITYAGKEYRATCAVSVENPSITVTSSSDTIEFSERDKGVATLTATVKPDNGKIEWSISDSGIAAISGNGTTATVTAKAEGSVTVTATYTANGTTVKDTCNLTVKKAASTLGISGFSYPSSGTVNSFSVSGTISSNYSLTRVELQGYSYVEALNFNYSLNASPIEFSKGTYEASCSIVTSHFINQFRNLYNSYSALATLVGADDSVQVHITVAVYDASGNCDVRNLVYTITG